MHLGPKGAAAILSNSYVLLILPASISEYVAAVIASATHPVEYVIAYYIVHHTIRFLRVRLQDLESFTFHGALHSICWQRNGAFGARHTREF